MKKLLLTLIAVLSLFTLSAQENPLFPKAGITTISKVSISSPNGNQELYSSQNVVSENDKLICTIGIYQSLDSENPVSSTKLTYTKTEKGYTIPIIDMVRDQLAQIRNISVVSTSGDYLIPETFEAGEKYPESSVVLKGDIMGNNVEVTISIKERETIGKESVEVPSGKYECMKYKETINVSVMGQDIVSNVTAWYYPGLGTVKQTTDSMGGMISTVAELVEVKDK